MSWGLDGLSGEAAEREEAALQQIMDGLLRLRVIAEGEVTWDPQHGVHWIRCRTTQGEDRDFSAQRFLAYAEGVADMGMTSGNVEAHKFFGELVDLRWGIG